MAEYCEESPLCSVVIVGRPNVGKSTLFNRLLGRRKALVHNLPGVTRDRNIDLVTRDEGTFQIVDTGGFLGDESDTMATLVDEQVEAAVEGGTAVLLVVDSKDGVLPVDTELARRLIKSGKRTALIVNKVDVDAHLDRISDFHSLGVDPMIPVSAEHGLGMDRIWDFLQESAAPAAPPADLPEDETPPIRVAIVGRPNVGKSSILNRILGETRSLVSNIPGTTRDPVDSFITWNNREFLVVDTAGIRRKSKTERGAELLSVLLARRSLERCDVAILVLDAFKGVSHQDSHIAGLIERSLRAGCVVLNKWDLVKNTERASEIEEAVEEKFAFLEYLPVERTSALTGRRVEKLLPLVDRIYQNYSQSLPTAVLNKEIEFLTRRVSIPAVQGKHMKIRYITQTGTAPPILTAFTNSRYPPPRNYSRYLKNALRKRFELAGSPLVLKFRKD